MDFHEAYLAAKGIQLGDDRRFHRGAYLGDVGPALVDDVAEVAIAITAPEHRRLRPFLGVLGFDAVGRGDHFHYRAGAFSLDVSVAAAPAYRIRRVRCTFTHPEAARRELRFGPDARLASQGASLTWFFGPDGAPES